MENTQEINYEYLDAIKYHQLEEKLTELGVSDAWKGGKAKKDIINDAISKLAKIKTLKEKGTADEDIQKELDLIKAEEQEQAEEALLQQQIQEEEEREAKKEQVKEKKLSPDQIRKSIDLIDRNLKNNIKGQRPILLKKRQALLDTLEEMGEQR